MIRELCLKTLLVALFACILLLGNLMLVTAQTSASNNLMIKIAPSAVEVSEKSHKIGAVGFINKHGIPAQAQSDITVHLKSEDTGIAEVPAEVTIPAGHDTAIFEIIAKKAGQTKVFASYGNSMASDVLVVGGKYDGENDLRIIVNIPASEMNVNSEVPFSLYLENSSGEISQAPFDIGISLEYEDSLIDVHLNEDSIRKGNSYVLGTIKSLDKVGNAFIRATADSIGFDEAKQIKISSSLPSSLAIDIFPDKVPATLKRDIDVIVSLVDLEGLPALAQQDVHLQFFSDDQSIGDQMDRIIKESNLNPMIKKGEFSYRLHLNLDHYEADKTSTIGVTTKGLGIAMDTFTTVTPITTGNPLAENKTMQMYALEKIPTRSQSVAIFQIGTLLDDPQTETEEKEFRPLIVNENYDSAGSEQKISMISSDSLLLRMLEIGKIASTSSYGTTIIETGQETGQVVISSTIKGIGAASATTEVINTLKQEKTAIFSPTGGDSILFDRDGFFDLYLISLDSKGRPTVAENEIRYLLTPINEILPIKKGTTSSHMHFPGSTIQQDGQKTITIKTIPIGESANADFEAENTFGVLPTAHLVLYVPFATLGPGSPQHTGTVQVLDLHGAPIQLPNDLRVKLTQSNLGVFQIPDSVTISKGQSYAEFPISTTEKDGKIALEATARGIVGAKADLESKSVIAKLKVSIGSVNEPLQVDQPAELKIYVDDDGQNGVGGATLKIVSSNSSISPDTIVTGDDGSATVHLSASNGPAASLQILATAEGFTGDEKTFKFSVSAAEEKKTELPEWALYAGVGAAAAIGIGMALFLRKPKKQDEEDEIYD